MIDRGDSTPLPDRNCLIVRHLDLEIDSKKVYLLYVPDVAFTRLTRSFYTSLVYVTYIHV